MFEAVLPNLSLLFTPKELPKDASAVPPVRYRRSMIRQALREYGHWLDQDTLARLTEELEGGPRRPR
jgi:hypothetical protein